MAKGLHRTFSFLLLSSAFSLLSSAACFAQTDKEIIKVGVIAPLTGGLARRGDDISKLLTILESHFNSTSRKYVYHFVVEDGKCGAGNEAVTIANRFVSLDKIRFAITVCTGEILQTGTFFQREHVLTFSIGSGHPDVRKLGDYVFRTFADNERGIHRFSEYILKTGKKRIAILTEQNAFTLALKDLLLKYLGAAVVFSDDLAADTADFNILLTKIKTKNIDALYFNTMSEGTLANLVNQARRMQLKEQIYSYHMAEAASFRASTGNNSDGLEFLGSPQIADGSEEFNNVLAEYVVKHKEGPSYEYLLRTTYDAAIAIFDGIETVGANADLVKDYLKSYSKKGALGLVQFDENGDLKRVNFMLKKIDNDGKVVVLDKFLEN